MSTTKPGVWTPELEAMLGKVPDSVLADLVKAIGLNGRAFSTLEPGERTAFDFFRTHGLKYGVVASLQDKKEEGGPTVVVKLESAESSS